MFFYRCLQQKISFYSFSSTNNIVFWGKKCYSSNAVVELSERDLESF